MSSKQSHTTHASAPTQADDLKRIHGIGPAIESHLYDIGVQTYAQIAALSPGDLAKLLHGFAGLSAQQIARHDWIGQARELAEAAPRRPDPEPASPERRQRYATFTTDLLLDNVSNVRRTSAAHVQSGAQETWTGWAGAELINFFAVHAGLRSSATTAPPAPDIVLQGMVHLSGLAAFAQGADDPVRLLHASQPFDVHLDLDLSEVAIPDGDRIAYCVQISAKKLGEPARTLLGSITGSSNYPEVGQLAVLDLTLPVGLYRLEASGDFVVAMADMQRDITGAVEAGQGMRAFLEGSLLQVY
jgi:hypothetical protein